MRHVRVTLVHQPDAGQKSGRQFIFQDPLDVTDLATAREFAFKALAEGSPQKGHLTVAFPEAASFSFRFERTGLIGYSLTPTPAPPVTAPRA